MDFRNDLDDAYRQLIPEGKRELTIVLFGPTQVGKTTLLLQLLGVDDAFAGAVADVLRAGRPRGSSSTSGATQYF